MGLENPSHIAILVVVLLLVFGAKRLPEIGRSLGSGMREFKDSISGGSDRPEPSQQQPTLTPAAQQPQAPAQAPPVAGPATPPATPAEPQP
ncbi:MAG: twin-arginine translocase TatA/TatE family subunit [Solirubrobacterales bacterium]